MIADCPRNAMMKTLLPGLLALLTVVLTAQIKTRYQDVERCVTEHRFLSDGIRLGTIALREKCHDAAFPFLP